MMPTALLTSLAALALSASVDYELLLPGADDPVRYNIEFTQQPAPGDTLAPCSYLIVSTPQAENAEESFSAYFDGNFFRFKGGKITEFHAGEDPMPFSAGLQRTELFTQLLPAFVGEKLHEMASDTSYIYKVYDERIIKGSEQRLGYLLKEYEYRLDSVGRPVYIEIVANPGEPSEQTATAKYTYKEADTEKLSEGRLEQLFPDQFARFRAKNFTLSSLQGQPMPTFSLPASDNSRMTHHRGEKFDENTVFAFITLNDRKIADILRKSDIKVVYVLSENNLQAVEEALGTLSPHETVLLGASSLIRDCGVKTFPSVVLCGENGMIEKIAGPLNNDIENIVVNLLSN